MHSLIASAAKQLSAKGLNPQNKQVQIVMRIEIQEKFKGKLNESPPHHPYVPLSLLNFAYTLPMRCYIELSLNLLGFAGPATSGSFGLQSTACSKSSTARADKLRSLHNFVHPSLEAGYV